MTDAINRCNASETAACCCVDVGTVMDNTDCTAAYSHTFDSRSEAEAMLKSLTAKARDVESDPCVIESSLTETAEGTVLDCNFTFCCQAETLIFQLGLR